MAPPFFVNSTKKACITEDAGHLAVGVRESASRTGQGARLPFRWPREEIGKIPVFTTSVLSDWHSQRLSHG